MTLLLSSRLGEGSTPELPQREIAAAQGEELHNSCDGHFDLTSGQWLAA